MIKRVRQLVEGRAPRDVIDMLIAAPLGLGAMAYAAGYSVKRGVYTAGLCPVVKPAVPTISVGNLTLGGTGKTPFTIFLCDRLTEGGRRCTVLSRGYARRKRTPEPLVVSDGERLQADAASAGDEPFLIAGALDGVPVIVARKRRLAAIEAMSRFAPDVLILDDGFQHWPLARDINLVLWDARLVPSDCSLFPLGPLREPLTALRRADAVILTRPPARERLERVERQIERIAGSKPRFVVDFAPEFLVSLDGSRVLSRAESTETKFYAFCGLAHPEKFQRSLEKFGAKLTGSRFYPDHFYYTERDVARLEKHARSRGAEALVTTAKDAVKLHDLADRIGIPVYILSIEARFQPDEKEADFLQWLERKLPKK